MFSMTNSYKRTTWNLRGNLTNYRKLTPILMQGYLVDLSNKEEETDQRFKRTVYENRDGQKKHGKYLMVKYGKSSGLWTCWTCGVISRYRASICDCSVKYIPPCKTNLKYKLLETNVKDSD